ncbi:MAG: NAD(P)H dehydrogenase (quinone) [Polaribacter sp.]|jgi:NAD(P)H dehydrogenase (quinone)
MAHQISLGIDANTSCEAIVRCLPAVSFATEQSTPSVPSNGAPYVEMNDLESCQGLIIGSPGYFGNMAAPLKYFLDQTSPIWLSGALIGKPAGVFTSTSSMHGGQESVLLSMMLPLLHHGMLISGIPYSENSLHQTSTGGTPYGASHVATQQRHPLSQDEIATCHALGKRIASLTTLLNVDIP